MWFKKVLIMLGALMLSACVAVDEKPEPVKVSGAAGFAQSYKLPSNAVATVALIDLNTPGVVIEQKSFRVYAQPILFQFMLKAEEVDPNVNYGVVALVSAEDKVIFQTYKRYPVINNKRFITEVEMQPVQ